jgi:hypothetical protein
LSHEQSSPSEWPRPQEPVPASRAKTGLKKKLPWKMPRNPLISLDSVERIQGNPRKSNPHKQGFSRRNGAGPRKSKRLDVMPSDKGFSAPFGSRRDRRLTAAAAAGVVLRVAGRIVRIGVHVVAGEDLGGRLRRGIDRLIGVAAGERERRNRQNDRDPHSRPPVQWRRGRRTRECGAVGAVAPRADGPMRAGARNGRMRAHQKQEQFLPPNPNQCYTVSCRRTKDRIRCGCCEEREWYIAQTV